MSWWHDPLRRFLYLYAALVLAGITALLTASQAISDRFLEFSAYPLLDNELNYFEQTWYEEGEAAARQSIAHPDPDDPFTFHFTRRLSEQEFEQIMQAEEGDEALFSFSDSEANSVSFSLSTQSDEADERFATVVSYLPLEDESWQELEIALDLRLFNQQFQLLHNLLNAVMAFLLLGFVIAWLVMRSIKQRLTSINQAGEAIQLAQDLSQRIPQDNLSGPLADTIIQLNRMLASIESSVAHTRSQANNIAHDLRTPLTIVYQKLQQQAMHNPQLLETQLMLERLLNTFNLLLRINRLESDGERIQLTAINTDMVVQDVAELYEPILEERGQQLNLSLCGGISYANHDLLFQVLSNLLDNASKFAGSDSLISLSSFSAGEQLAIEVADQGGGVAPEALIKLCDKFYRADSSRHSEGNGLGLSFVAAAAEKLGGTVTLENRPLNGKPGLCVRLLLPKSPQ